MSPRKRTVKSPKRAGTVKRSAVRKVARKQTAKRRSTTRRRK